MPAWVLLLMASAAAAGVITLLHVLAVDARDKRARHDFKNDVIRTRNEYVRRLRLLYDGGGDDDGGFEFVDDPIASLAADAKTKRAA